MMPEKNLLTLEMDELQVAVRNMCEALGWREHAPGEGPRTGYTFAAYIALLHSEATEMLEAYRDSVWSDTCTPDNAGQHHIHCRGKPHGPGKPIGVGPEMADVFIRLLDMCDLWNIDLVTETQRVMAYGWTRPYRHGGREL